MLGLMMNELLTLGILAEHRVVRLGQMPQLATALSSRIKPAFPPKHAFPANAKIPLSANEQGDLQVSRYGTTIALPAVGLTAAVTCSSRNRYAAAGSALSARIITLLSVTCT